MDRMIDFVPNSASVDDGMLGRIILGASSEKFLASCAFWGEAEYRAQWAHAARYCVENNRTSCFITNFGQLIGGVRRVDLFCIIPEREAYPRDFFEGKIGIDEGYYITSKFLFLSENVRDMYDKQKFEAIALVMGSHFPIIPLPRGDFEVLYSYLEPRIQGISNWRVSSPSLRTLLK